MLHLSLYRVDPFRIAFLTTYLCTASFVLYLIRPGFTYLLKRVRGTESGLFVKDEDANRYVPWQPREVTI